jgi:spore photoproduct lyase
MRDIAFLLVEDAEFIERKSLDFRLSYQDKRILNVIASDLRRWGEGSIRDIWKEPQAPHLTGRDSRKRIMNYVKTCWEELKVSPKDYTGFNADYSGTGRGERSAASAISGSSPDTPILGRCPVASEKTRCCNLQTLDAVINCGYDCSYCSIRTFYHTDEILFHQDLQDKLKKVSAGLDPSARYHMGTGQSSDSLMWGNRNGMLDDLFTFARSNPNVILELKTKSANIDYLLKNDIPANVITTWSLNTPVIIKNEEHLTAYLDERLEAAEQVADRGGLIGFHFHPIIIYKGWKDDYGLVFDRLIRDFRPEEVCHISFGTLTFIKPVIKELRKRELKSKILQMPLTEAAGKLSYPLQTREKIFSFAYDSFKAWHDKVFFYLCMEDISLWKAVFGREYSSNEEFEKDMIDSYCKKAETRWKER